MATRILGSVNIKNERTVIVTGLLTRIEYICHKYDMENTVRDGSFVYFEPTTDYDRGYLIAKEVKKANLKSRFPVNRN